MLGKNWNYNWGSLTCCLSPQGAEATAPYYASVQLQALPLQEGAGAQEIEAITALPTPSPPPS